MDQATIPIMSTIDMRDDILKWVDQVDESFLSAVHAMMGTYVTKQEKVDPIIGYTLDGQPKYASKMKAIYDEEVRAAEEDGAFITLEELEEESATW